MADINRTQSRELIFMAHKKRREEEFKGVVDPIIKWLAENVHPHYTVIVTASGAELLEGEIGYSTLKFIKNKD